MIKKTRRIAKMLKKTLVLTVLFIAFTAGAALAEDTDHFVTGTKVNGIGIGGLTVDEAKGQIEGFYSREYKLTVKEQGGKTEVIGGDQIGYKAVVPEGLQAILTEQNATGRLSGPSVDNSHTMQMTSQHDEAALSGQIQALKCISGSGIVMTSDARISAYQEGVPFTIIPEVQGNNVDVDKTTALIKAAVAAGQAEVDLEASGCYYTVNQTASSQTLVDLCNLMNQCKDMTITYQIGDTSIPLAGQTICTWILGSENGQMSVDRNQAAALVKTVADQADTAGKVRTFHTVNGKDVELTGAFGWKVNQAAETDALIAMIRTGQTQVREPEYSKKAAAHGTDWGTTYVEIDLTGQHVYMIKDGVAVWDAPCVTGNVSKNYTTPPGIYSLAYKEKDRILRGEKKPDGTYEYESHVNYWMPFNGGIGLHDADWRAKFGGTIYQYSGSHGCVNLPPAKAQLLYDMVYTGIPVICYN